MSKKKPNFLIAGVARCGTTSLYHYLRQHPQIGLPTIKEPKYFSSLSLVLPQNGIGDETVFSKIVSNEKQYDQLFLPLKNYDCIGEASSDYFYYNQSVIPKVKEKLGDVKIIICLRNPVDRSYSAYSNLIRDSRETLSFAEALEEEDNRVANNWDWMWHYKNGSLYSEALEYFQNEFSNVHIVLFEDLESHPKKVLRDIFKFLNVNENIDVDVNTRYSHSGKPNNSIVAALTNRNNPLIFKFREIALKMIPRKYLENIASKLFKKDDLDLKVRKNLQSFFAKDISKLEKLIQRDLSNWK